MPTLAKCICHTEFAANNPCPACAVIIRLDEQVMDAVMTALDSGEVCRQDVAELLAEARNYALA